MTKMLTAVVDLYYPNLWLSGVSYTLCLLPSPCSVVLFSDDFCSTLSSLQLSLSSGILLIGALLVLGFGVLQPLLSRVFCIIAPLDSLSGLCAS